ncbi:uncharacterized protein LOC117180541 [Belonocnema kinseyi]|uniref:uncharacterized protein LOC117180541 n=1 Tax=Belonocnema kinseyi TaxID=2817044 RepID=UPI00143CE955|nr:uncharacterized protein LOC117180541 [Belonocnema kinseyi]
MEKKKVKSIRFELGHKNWWDEECSRKKRKARKLYKKWKDNKGSWEAYAHERSKYRKMCEDKEKKRKDNELEEIKNAKTEKDIWKYINKQRKKKNSISSGIMIRDWKNYFMDHLEGTEAHSTTQGKRNNLQEDESDLSDVEINDQIKKLRMKKAPGEDEIPNEAWVYLEVDGKRKLFELIRRMWNEEGFPNSWRKRIITPIFKKGETEDLKNYRPMTLLNKAYKLYAMILNERLVKDLEEKKILPGTQAGFRKNNETMDNIYILQHFIQRELEPLIIAVRVNGYLTDEFCIEDGLKQDCPVSATLFTVLISDIEEEMRKEIVGGIKVESEKFLSFAYVDDIALLANNEEDFRAMMRRFEKFSEKKCLVLNVEKSKVMVFKKVGGREKERKWNWKGVNVDLVVGVLAYRAELWGWEEKDSLERIQERYLWWTLGLDRYTPSYMVLEESKIEKLRVKLGRRAIKFEEGINNSTGRTILKECLKEKNSENLKIRSVQEREQYLKRCGYSQEGLKTLKDKRANLRSSFVVNGVFSNHGRPSSEVRDSKRAVIARYGVL